MWIGFRLIEGFKIKINTIFLLRYITCNIRKGIYYYISILGAWYIISFHVNADDFVVSKNSKCQNKVIHFSKVFKF